ncbi:MAG: hypothetical protein JWR32_6304 [Mycobacterium sp.]|nr:hypothetical protein [Mycobacterium sp.]
MDSGERWLLVTPSVGVALNLAQLIDSFESTLGAATPLQLEADPYLTTTLWAGAFRAEEALRHDNHQQPRRDVRVALEHHAFRDIVESRPYDDGAPVRDVLIKTADAGRPAEDFGRTARGFGSPAAALARCWWV